MSTPPDDLKVQVALLKERQETTVKRIEALDEKVDAMIQKLSDYLLRLGIATGIVLGIMAFIGAIPAIKVLLK